MFGLGLVGTEGVLPWYCLLELIVLFDLRLSEVAQGNEVFGQGFSQAKLT